MSRLFRAALAALSLAAVLGLPVTAHAATPTKVAIIVGPVGSLTPTYLALADAAAAAAEARGAVVARAYSPNATPANVLAAVADAHVIVYFGHGYGHPSPYGGLNTAKQNGWALQGPAANGTHGDAGGQVAYYGEDWIVANARPAPGFVMIYSNTCYAPGASEGGHAPATPWQAAQRVAYYSRAVFAMGGSAYFATDFDRGAADLLGRLLGDRTASFGTAFASDHRFVGPALTSQAHPFSAGQTIWLHRSKYTDGPPNYWYAFAGNPDASPLLSWDRTAPTATMSSPAAGAVDIAPGASITLRMSETVVGVSADTISLHDASGGRVAAEVAYDQASGVVTLRPERPLALSSRYGVAVSDGIRDSAGRAFAPTTWAFSTRVDADPLSSNLSIVLEAGAHELVRVAPDGSVAERRPLEVVDRRWLLADRRARLLGLPGAWLRLHDTEIGGWWVAESGAAHAFGRVEEARLVQGTRVTLSAGTHEVHGFDAEGPEVAGDGMAVAGGTAVLVDRRRVFDGRTFVRLVGPELAGAWVEIDPSVSPTEGAARRVLGTEARAAEARFVVASADVTAFRFDDAGRVIDRRGLADTDPASGALTTRESRVVGGTRFAIVARGELAGWALAEGPQVQVLPLTPAPDTAD
ncbi:MAG TPA: Ig-like domain-containing protein [Candidatus Limnocylindria bacterium]